jgi:hypothetical protein
MKPSTETHPKQAPEQKNLIALDGTLDRVQGLRLVIQEKGIEADPTQVRMHHRDSVKELIRCHNPNCFQGGFSLGNLLRELVRSRQEDYIGINYCKGYEGDPCRECGQFTMVRNGTCLKCDTCGTTSGCS